MSLALGTKLGPYEIVSPLGAGGMGEVYCARDTRLDRKVAVKILPAHLADTPEMKQRFDREARAVSSLSHPHICALYDVGHQDGVDFLVMEYLEGETLAQRIAAGPLTIREAVHIAVQVSSGLAAAHSRGVIHRDVKPSNIILTNQGFAKIVDFGLARFLASDTTGLTKGVTGTINYMSPEQALGKPLDPRTDVWSLGVVLLEMLTARNPFQRENVTASLFAIINESPGQIPDSIPPELQKIIYRSLSKDAAGRYPDCGVLLEDLETFRSSFISSNERSVDQNAPTMTLRPADLQKYAERASVSAWTPTPAPRKSARKWWVAAGTVIVVIAVALALSPVRAALANLIFGAPQNHVAVLPFENIGNNPANAPLAEGLMDSLSGALSNLDIGNQSLWVVPSSVVRARKVEDPSAALRQLGATLVVQGSIERDGKDVRLNVNLINAKTLRQIGSAQFEDPAGDLATIQNEAVSRLANLMGLSVTPDMLKNTGGKANPAAYQSYLTALGYIQRYDKPGNLDLAVSSLNDAVKTDPTFALGYAELGEAYRLKNVAAPDPHWLSEAEANGQRAAQLDPSLPAVHISLARIQDTLGKYDLALQEFQRALQLDSHSAEALSGMAGTYEHMGRISDAEAAFQKAAALRPDYWGGYNSLGIFYTHQRRYQDAAAQFHRVIELTPDNAQAYFNLAAVYLDAGDPKLFPQVEQALEKSIQIAPSYAAYANLGLLYYNERRFSDSAAMTEKALALNDGNYRVWSNLVASYKWLKDDSKAAAARQRELPLVLSELKRQPQDAVAQSELAGLYAQQNMRDDSLLRIRSALALSPNDPRVLLNIGEAYEDLGNRPEALHYIEKAVQKGYTLADLKSDPYLQDLLSDPKFRPSEN
jgi:eukaryotic-like serine/threonine-protein kinase